MSRSHPAVRAAATRIGAGVILAGLVVSAPQIDAVAARPSVVGWSAPAQSSDVEVTFGPATVQHVVGDHFTLRSTIVVTGDLATQPMMAHLNVASLTGDVYVDPEDWSPSRSKQVEALQPGQSVTLTWDLQAVNSGTFDIYVVLLPNGRTDAGDGPLVVTSPVYATVTGKQTPNPGGALPIVLGIPAVLGLVLLGSRYRRRSTAV
jgi:uncharacterized cupredoxin-like copper-binding protein